MRSIREIESEMWELGQKMEKLHQEYLMACRVNTEKLMTYLNEDGSWNIEKMKKDGII